MINLFKAFYRVVVCYPCIISVMLACVDGESILMHIVIVGLNRAVLLSERLMLMANVHLFVKPICFASTSYRFLPVPERARNLLFQCDLNA